MEPRGTEVTRRIAVPPAAVWSVLSDGWLYASWVVGSSRIRKVDPAWPAEGARVHHSFGVWPLVLDDVTESVRCRPDRELLLKAEGRPAGQATVRLRLEPDGPDGTVVGITEDVTGGPARLVPRALRQLGIVPRNVEALRRLAYLAEGRHQP